MNIYRIKFFARCRTLPAARIEYFLELHKPDSDNVLMVEDLIDAVDLLDRGMHEEFADQLYREFGGFQRLTAHHHGVDIETTRGTPC